MSDIYRITSGRARLYAAIHLTFIIVGLVCAGYSWNNSKGIENVNPYAFVAMISLLVGLFLLILLVAIAEPVKAPAKMVVDPMIV